MKPHLKKRVEHLQTLMREADLDAVIFADRENLIYYFGVTEIECMGAVIPAQGDPVGCCLWLDAPYVRERSACENLVAYRFPASNIGLTIVEAMRKAGLDAPRRVGFHKYFVDLNVFTELRTAFPDMEYIPATEMTYRVRSVKDADELALMERACGFLSKGMEAAIAAAAPGVSEVEVLAEADYAMRKAGSEGASFRMQVLTPGKQLLAHPYADGTRMEANQAVVVHLGASYCGYVAKMCRTVALGDIQEETRTIHDVLLRAQNLSIELLKPGACVADIYDRVDALVAESGYGGMILDHLGYGVGIRQSEFFPIVGKGLNHVLKQDMVVDLLLPTIYKRGVGGPRITDVIRVDETGGRLMTTFPRELVQK